MIRFKHAVFFAAVYLINMGHILIFQMTEFEIDPLELCGFSFDLRTMCAEHLEKNTYLICCGDLPSGEQLHCSHPRSQKLNQETVNAVKQKHICLVIINR